MSLQLIGSLYDLLVQRMGHAVGDGDHDGLIHLVRNHQADSGLTGRSSVFHLLFLLLAAGELLLADDGLDPGDILLDLSDPDWVIQDVYKRQA